MNISANALFTSEVLRPRSLGCRSLSLAQIASRNGLTIEGRDGDVVRFSTLSDLRESGGVIVTYLTSARFAGLLRSGDDVAVVTRPDLRTHLHPGNIALTVDQDPHDAFYTAFTSASQDVPGMRQMKGTWADCPVVVMDDEVRDSSMILLKAIRAIGDAVMCSIAFGKIPCGLDHLVGVSSGGGITGSGKVGEAVSKVGLDLGVSLNVSLIGGCQVGDVPGDSRHGCGLRPPVS